MDAEFTIYTQNKNKDFQILRLCVDTILVSGLRSNLKIVSSHNIQIICIHLFWFLWVEIWSMLWKAYAIIKSRKKKKKEIKDTSWKSQYKRNTKASVRLPFRYFALWNYFMFSIRTWCEEKTLIENKTAKSQRKIQERKKTEQNKMCNKTQREASDCESLDAS